MIALRALLLCDSVRADASGTMTARGICNERIVVPPGEGPIVFASISVLFIVAGLRGIDGIAHRELLREAGDPDPPQGAPFVSEPHDPESDEHNFVFTSTPMVFPEPGAYEIVAAVEAGGTVAEFSARFFVSRENRSRISPSVTGSPIS